MTRLYLFLVTLLFISPNPAFSFEWISDPEDSSIDFTAMFSGAPSAGRFNKFDANIFFDKEKLDQSKVRVTIDITSVAADFPSVAETLLTEPWFDAENHPTAEFSSNTIRVTADGGYEAEGTLTMRGVENAAVLLFQFSEYGEHGEKPNMLKAIMKGQTTVQRTKYNIGQGEWSGTSVVADDVVINVRVTAEAVVEELTNGSESTDR